MQISQCRSGNVPEARWICASRRGGAASLHCVHVLEGGNAPRFLLWASRTGERATPHCIRSAFCLLHVLSVPHSYTFSLVIKLSIFSLWDSPICGSNRIRTSISCVINRHAGKVKPELFDTVIKQFLIALDWLAGGVFLVLEELKAWFLAPITIWKGFSYTDNNALSTHVRNSHRNTSSSPWDVEKHSGYQQWNTSVAAHQQIWHLIINEHYGPFYFERVLTILSFFSDFQLKGCFRFC